jgi:integral membrane protein (TIGR01906 family)
VQPGWTAAILRFGLTIALPAFLALTSVRLVMSVVFLQVEYHRPGFPDDPFGFTRADRLHYAPYAVRYLLNDADIGYLGDLRLDGEPLFTERELRHMQDVKVVTRAALGVHAVLAFVLGGTVLALAWRPETRHTLRRALFDGGVLTIGLVVLLVVLILASWDTFFTDFHRIFFEGDSWQFSTSDALIRLFPEQFWFDTAITIGLLTVTGALAAMFGARYWEDRALRRARQQSQPGVS